MDITALGECLIDFVSMPGKNDGKIHMEGNPGGAPANALAAAAKLGRKTAFIGKVGQDSFGNLLRETIEKAGIDARNLIAGNEPTTLAMVTLDETGNRSFGFYRNQTADVMLRLDEVNLEQVKKSTVFHFGTVSMTANPAAETTLEVAKAAKQAGVLISFDPNYRQLLWENPALAIQAMQQGMELADYVKVSDEEAEMITGEKNPEKAAIQLQNTYNLSVVAVTLGEKGCVGATKNRCLAIPTYKLPCVDTTGAGDAFWGAALHRLLAVQNVSEMSENELAELLRYANAAGTLATTQYGAIPALATEEEIYQCMQTAPLLQ